MDSSEVAVETFIWDYIFLSKLLEECHFIGGNHGIYKQTIDFKTEESKRQNPSSACKVLCAKKKAEQNILMKLILVAL